MKKIYTTLCVALVASSSVFAQKQVASVERFDMPEFNFAARTPTDTLLPGDFFSGSPALYTATEGYVVGNNQYNDEVKAQVFILNEGTMLEGVLFWFGAKVDGGNGSNVGVAAYAMDGTTGTTSVGSGQPCPGTMLGSASVALSDVDTSDFTAVNFSSPVYVPGDFALGFDVTGFSAGDTLGLVSSSDGDGGQAELTWERWEGGAWYTMLAAWPLDFDFGILAVVDNSTSGIEDDSFFNGIKADVMPNPAVETANVVFELENAGSVDLMIIDLSGKIVYTMDKAEMAKGRHTVNVPVSELAAGTYYYSIGVNGNRLTKKMVVTK
jgi:hypothetical protein